MCEYFISRKRYFIFITGSSFMKKKKKSNVHIYLNLSQSFLKLRTLFSSPDINANKLDAVLGDLRFARKQIQKHAKRRPRKILTECIDTLFEMIEEGNREKITDFLDLIRDMPEIALKKRTFRSFAREISAFNHKYEEFCFGDINTIHIQISKETVKKILKASKVNFWAMFIGGIAAFILPWIFYAIKCTYLTHLSHDIGLHCVANMRLPEGVELAYDGLKIEV